MIPKGFKRPQITEITEEKGVARYLLDENEIELSSEFLFANCFKSRIALRHELVHALDNYKGRLNGLSGVFLSEIRAYYFMMPRRLRKGPLMILILPFIPFFAIASIVSVMRGKQRAAAIASYRLGVDKRPA